VKRSTVVLALCAGLVILATGYLLLAPKRGLPDSPLRAMPADIHGFARVRSARILASRPWREIVIERKEDHGIRLVTALCGFNPLASLSEIFAFARSHQGKTEVAVNARGSLTQTQLIDCLGKYSGGSLENYVHERIAGFDSVRGKKRNDRAAFVGRDAFVAGGSESVSAALRAIAGEIANAESDPMLVDLYGSLSPDSDFALVARVPSDAKQRAAFRDRFDLPEELLTSARGLALELHLIEDRIGFHARLVADTPARSSKLREQSEQLRERILAFPGLGLVGIDAPLRALKLESNGRDLLLRGEIKASTVNLLIDRLPALAAMASLASGMQRAAAGDGGVPRDAAAP
jgi:hypothetical protein